MVHANYERNPRRLVVLLDVNPSVTGGLGDWKPVLAAARDMLASLPSHVSVARMIFATEKQIVGGFDESRAAILAKIGSLETVNRQTVKAVGKGTALFDAASGVEMEVNAHLTSKDGATISLAHDFAQERPSKPVRGGNCGITPVSRLVMML